MKTRKWTPLVVEAGLEGVLVLVEMVVVCWGIKWMSLGW